MTNQLRIALGAVVALGLCGWVGNADAAGFTTGQVGWGTNCWYSGNDADGDGLNQSCEQALATVFAPTEWFDNGEDTDAWWPHYAVKSVNYATKQVSIAYYSGYYRDGGGLFGLTSHDGDSEFVIVEAHLEGSTWLVDWVYFAAHRNASVCDDSSWYPYWNVQWDYYYRGWAMVFVSENKHAAYRSDSQCDGACFGGENCDYDYWRVPATNRNVGQSWGQLMSVVQLGSAYEWFWDVNKKFCGWRRGGYYADHSGCASAYYDHLKDFGY